MKAKEFQNTIYSHFRAHGRVLPWRYEQDPYKVFVSEVMLQQTQVSRVVPKYKEWLEKFPTVESLAQASLRDVLFAWQGLGYNRRGKHLKTAAEIIVSDFGGVVPETVEELMELPGIGYATASAIAAYAFNKPVVFVETNIRAVYLYFYFKNKQHISDNLLAEIVEKTMDRANSRQWYYALTDYGNFLKTKEKFKNTQSKHYVKQSKFKGSNRQVRGMVLKLLTQRKHMLFVEISKMIKRDPQTIQTVIDQLVSEDLVVCDKRYYKIA